MDGGAIRGRDDGSVLDGPVSGSATGHFIAQRVSAVLVLVLGAWFVLSVGSFDSLQYQIVVRFLASPLNSVLTGLLCAAMAYHSYLGVQVVIEDYVHSPRLSWFSLMLSRAVHLAVGLLCVYYVYEIGFGA